MKQSKTIWNYKARNWTAMGSTTDNNNDCVRRPTTDNNNACVKRPTTDNNNACVERQIKEGRHSFWDPHIVMQLRLLAKLQP